MTNRSASNSFWLSVLLHLLLLFSFIFYIRLHPVEKKQPTLFTPAYVYKGAITPTSMVSQTVPRTQTETATRTTKAPIPENKATPLKRAVPAKKDGVGLREIMASSYRILQANQFEAVHAMVKNSEPIYMVGDTSSEADPLIVLLGRALSKHFRYPDMAGKFGIAGRVLVRLTVHPEGDITDVIMVESSDNHDLDSAALYAVNAAPIIKGADKYINKPKTVVIGFIFRNGSRG